MAGRGHTLLTKISEMPLYNKKKHFKFFSFLTRKALRPSQYSIGIVELPFLSTNDLMLIFDILWQYQMLKSYFLKVFCLMTEPYNGWLE